MALAMRKCLRAVAVAVLLSAVPCVPAKAGEGMFLKLGDIFRYEDHSRTTAKLEDGSTFSFECDRYVSERGVIADRDRPALVVRTVCESPDRPRRGTVVWLHGGPFGKAPEAPTAEQAAMLGLGYDLVMPLYPGSADRELDVRPSGVTPNFEGAIAEIEVAVRVAQRNGGRVVLVGDSFGSLLAAAAARVLRGEDRLIIERPMLRSYRALVPLEEVLIDAPVIQDGAPVTDKSPQERSDLVKDTLERFAGPWLDRDVISILQSNPPRNLLVIYREKDPKSSVERMPELLALGAGRYRTLPLPGAEHDEIDTRPLLDLFIREVESWDNLRPAAAAARARKSQ